MRKCLKVKYLGRIGYDFQKSSVTGPWDHKVSVSAKKAKKKFHACVPLINHHIFKLVKYTSLPFLVLVWFDASGARFKFSGIVCSKRQSVDYSALISRKQYYLMLQLRVHPMPPTK